MTTAMLMSLLVRGVLLLAATAACVGVLRRASAAHRHLAWSLGTVALLALPALTPALPSLRLPVLPREPISAPGPRHQPAPAMPMPGDAVATRPQPAAAVPPVATAFERGIGETGTLPVAVPPAHQAVSPVPPAPRSDRRPSLLVVAWLVGGVLVGLRLVAGMRASRRLVRGARGQR